MALMALPLLALAQTPPDPNAAAAARASALQDQVQQERDRAQQRERQSQTPDVRLPTSDEEIPAVLPSETPCFKLDTIALDVPATLPEHIRSFNDPVSIHDAFAFARRWLNRYAGQCVGQHGVELLRKGVLAQILARGFVTTRVLLSDQDLSKGMLRFELLPGTINEIRFADSKVRGTWRSAFPSRSGDLLNLRDIEQGLEQMKRAPSQEADMKIEPATQAGTSDIVITVQRSKPWKVVFGMDNSGTRETGKFQGTATFGLDNPLGLNDLFSIGVSNDIYFTDKKYGTHGLNAYYSVPWGNWTFSLSGNKSTYFQHIAGANQTFLSQGDTKTLNFRIDRLLYRDQYSKTGIEAQISRRYGRSYIEDTEIGAQHRDNTFFELGLTRRQYAGAATLDATLAYKQGVPWFGAQGDLYDPDTGQKLSQTYLYKMATLDASLSVPFNLGSTALRYASTFRGQFTNQHLFYIDDISIGSFYSVRGFDGEYLLSAEKGFTGATTLKFPSVTVVKPSMSGSTTVTCMDQASRLYLVSNSQEPSSVFAVAKPALPGQ
jgi:hemolysin activation/secretion protein